jgi:hypothetical protein
MRKGYGSGPKRRSVTALAVLGLLVPLLVLSNIAPAAAAFTTPRYVRSIGGMGRPGVFSWGTQWNPISNEMLVGDYLHFKVRRYDLSGNHLGDFWNDGDCGQPYTVGVDARDGAIYVAELKDNPFRHCIAKYDKAGNFLYRIQGSGSGGADDNTSILNMPRTSSAPRAFYPVWMTVEEDTGDVFILDSHYTNTDELDPPEMLQLRFDDVTKSLMVVAEWPVMPPEIPLAADCTNPIGCAPRIYGVDIVTAPGNPNDDMIYMTDAWNRRAYKYNKAGEWQDTFAEGQTGGDNRGVVVNEALDRVYIVDAEHSDIDVYRMDGSYVNSFASAGGDSGEFAGGGRQTDIDGAGNVWVADFGGFETEKYSPTGTPLLTAPTPARKPPVGLLGQPRDVAVDKDTGEVWVADSWNQRFQRFSATGVSMGAWGQRGPGGPFDMNYPRSIAVQKRANGSKRIWLSNERGHHLQVYNYPTTAAGSPTYVAQIGQIGQDNTEPGHFRWPVDIEFYNRPASGCDWCDGKQVAIVGDRMAASIKILDAETFAELAFIEQPALAVAVDPATGLIYALQGTRVRIYDQAGNQLGQFGSSGTADGQFRDTTDAVFAGGNLYITDELTSRVTAWTPAANPTQDPAIPTDDLTATYLGKWGSTYGPNVYDFRGAIGIDADATGRLYVTDSGNDRIQVFDPAQGKVPESVNPPLPVVQQPSSAAANLTTLGPVTLSGTATDDTAVGNVELSVQDFTTGLWWNASNQSWEATQTNSIAAYSATNANNVSWRWVFLGVSAQGRYVVMAKTRDHNGNLSQPVMRTFAMPGATAPPVPAAPVLDTARPNGIQLTPTANQVFPRAAVNFTGTATDNVGVTSVRIAIKRLSDGRWLSSPTSSSFGTAFRWMETAVDVPGATAVNWTFTWTTPPSAGGAFQTLVEARDAVGNVDTSKPQIPFSTTNLLPDLTAPETTMTAPTGTEEPFDIASGVTITGDATDNIGVGGVRLAITNLAGLTWTGSGWSSGGTGVEATLTTPAAVATDWSYTFNPPVGDIYTVTATARDTGGLADPTPTAPVSFTVTGSLPDTVAPDATVTVPTNNQVLPISGVTFTGNATDNIGVADVKVAIRNRTTLRWWNGSSWVTATTWLPGAVLTGAGTPVTGWSFSWTPPATGLYAVTVRAEDAVTPVPNYDLTRPWVNFSVS